MNQKEKNYVYTNDVVKYNYSVTYYIVYVVYEEWKEKNKKRRNERKENSHVSPSIN